MDKAQADLMRAILGQVAALTAQVGRAADAIEKAVELGQAEQEQKQTWEPEHYRSEA